MIIDAHHHLWTADYPWLAAPGLEPIRRDYTVDDLRLAIGTAGVGATILVEGGRGDLAETRTFLATAAGTAEIAGVVGWASFTDPDLMSTLDELRAGPGGAYLVGIRDQVQAITDPDYLARPAVRAGLTTIGTAGLVVDLVVRRDQLPACARAAAASPQTVFVLDHLGKPQVDAEGLAEWHDLVADFAALDNTVAKLSGLLTEIPRSPHVEPTARIEAIVAFVDAALELFGPDRLMLGSDWPVCELVASYRDTWHALDVCLTGLAPEERSAILGGTARRTYQLS